MYLSSTAPSLPPLLVHLPGFEFSSDRETPISNPPSSVFSSHSAAPSTLSSTSISPLSLVSTTPINQSAPISQRTKPNNVFQRASTLPLTNHPSVPRLAPPTQCQLPEGFQKCFFVDSLVDTGALVIETIWPTQTIPIPNSKILPLRVFIQETIRRSRTSFSTLQLALYYLLRIKSEVHDFEKKNPEWFNAPCKFGKTATKHPIACGRRMFLAAVIVASKYLQDRNYSNRAWAKISGLPVKEINANEFVFLNVANYELYVGEALYKRWSGVLLNHVMATVSVSAVAATIPPVGLATPPLTPIMSPLQTSPSPNALYTPNTLRIALAQRFCNAIRNLSPQLTEAELSSLHVLCFQSPQQKSMSPPPSRNGLGQVQQTFNNPSFPLNPLLSQSRVPPYDTALPSPSSSVSDSASDSETWSPISSVSSASSNDQTNISPRTNLGRSYLKNLGCPKANSAKSQSVAPPCLSKRNASPLSIIAACNDQRRTTPMSGSPMRMEDVRLQLPSTPRLRQDSTPASNSSDEDTDWCSSAVGTIDPKLLSLNSSALTAVKGLCSLSQKATVFQQSSLPATSSPTSGEKRTFVKSYSMGNVPSDYEAAKRRRGAISDQTLARVL